MAAGDAAEDVLADYASLTREDVLARGMRLRLGTRAGDAGFPRMSLKQQIHALVDELPDDSPLLVEVRETLRMNQAIAEAMDDARPKAINPNAQYSRRLRNRAASLVP